MTAASRASWLPTWVSVTSLSVRPSVSRSRSVEPWAVLPNELMAICLPLTSARGLDVGAADQHVGQGHAVDRDDLDRAVGRGRVDRARDAQDAQVEAAGDDRLDDLGIALEARHLDGVEPADRLVVVELLCEVLGVLAGFAAGAEPDLEGLLLGSRQRRPAEATATGDRRWPALPRRVAPVAATVEAASRSRHRRDHDGCGAEQDQEPTSRSRERATLHRLLHAPQPPRSPSG